LPRCVTFALPTVRIITRASNLIRQRIVLAENDVADALVPVDRYPLAVLNFVEEVVDRASLEYD
jgi:hypothetical protein